MFHMINKQPLTFNFCHVCMKFPNVCDGLAWICCCTCIPLLREHSSWFVHVSWLVSVSWQSIGTHYPRFNGFVVVFIYLYQSLLVIKCRALCDPNMLKFCKEGGTQLLEGLDFDHFSINNSKSVLAHVVINFSFLCWLEQSHSASFLSS